MNKTNTCDSIGRKIVCWSGADGKLYQSLSQLNRPDLCVAEQASYFLELVGEKRPARIILSGTPRYDALQLLATIRTRDVPVPVWIALDNPDPDDVRIFLREGADDVFWVDEIVQQLPEVQESAGGTIEEPVSNARNGTGLQSVVTRPVEAGPKGAPESAIQEAGEIICVNNEMQRIMDTACRIATTDSTVLIQGESGTGKEMIASLVHAKSRRRDREFIRVNCGAIPEPLLESQLYGHEKGSFTGAVKQQKGLFEKADNGTLLLDEIGELGFEMQVKLLRFLQGREFRRVGGNEVLKVNVRILAATNKDLKDEVARGRFRMDLFYRLNVINFLIPPLRDRPEEIGILVEHFVKKMCREKQIPPKNFSPEAIARLRALPWPGNIRELENAVERLLLLAPGEMVVERDVIDHLDLDLRQEMFSNGPAGGRSAPGMQQGQSRREEAAHNAEQAFPTLAEVERIHIEKVLAALKWNKMRTSRVLGINVKTLYNKIRAYQLTPPHDLKGDAE